MKSISQTSPKNRKCADAREPVSAPAEKGVQAQPSAGVLPENPLPVSADSFEGEEKALALRSSLVSTAMESSPNETRLSASGAPEAQTRIWDIRAAETRGQLGGQQVELTQNPATGIYEAAFSQGPWGHDAVTPETLAAIVKAAPAEINRWCGPLTMRQARRIAPPIRQGIFSRFLDETRRLLGSIKNAVTSGIDALQSPILGKQRQVFLNRLELEHQGGRLQERIHDKGAFRVALFDSGNGGLAAAKVVSSWLDKITEGQAQLVILGDHGNQPYGPKTREEIIALVHESGRAAAKLTPDLLAFACNTACIALVDAEEKKIPLPGDGTPTLNLIDNTARAISANPRIFGRAPVILSTQATKESALYQQLIPKYSSGQTQPISIGASDAPTRSPEGALWKRDLATLVNELAHRNQERTPEVQSAVQHYVRQVPAEATSLVFCCTHYPELEPVFRREMDAEGLRHIPLFDPMEYQAMSIAERLAEQKTSPNEKSASKRGPHAVISTAQPDDMEILLNMLTSVPALTGHDIGVFHGKRFGDLEPELINRYLQGELNAIDLVTHGFLGRNIDTMYFPGGAAKVADRLIEAKTVLLMTGFNVPLSLPSAEMRSKPETDGPPGTAALASRLLSTGKKVIIATDERNQSVLQGAMGALGCGPESPNLVLAPFDARGEAAVEQAKSLLDRISPDVVGAIEVPGRDAAGSRTNLKGIDIDDFNPALDEILLQAHGRKGVHTFAIADGGNEAGAARLDLSKASIPHPSVVPATTCVTAENSNLGAYAILAEYARKIDRLDLLLSPEELEKSLAASIEAGAVDGISKKGELSVDGFPLSYHVRNLKHLNGAVLGTWPAEAGAPSTTKK